MSKKCSFSEVKKFYFHHGAYITSSKEISIETKTVNEIITAQGWRLVGKKELKELLDNYQKFLYQADGDLIGTKEESIEVIDSDSESNKFQKGDIFVPGIKHQENDLVYYEKIIIKTGLIPNHSDIFVLGVR